MNDKIGKIGIISFISILVLILAFRTFIKKVPAGYKGVKVYLLGSSKGVDSEELSIGWHFIWFNQELHLYPVFTQNYVWTKNPTEGSYDNQSISFQTREGLGVNGDFGITYRVIPDKVSVLFETFRRGVDEITDIFLRNIVRDGINKYASALNVESVYGGGKRALIDSVQQYVASEVYEKGISVEKVYLIGEFRLPAQVKRALDSKIEATQRAEQRENEVREAEAEARKKIAAAEGEAKSILLKAQAEAKANQIVSRSITSILVNYEKVKKWDGKLPQVSGQNGLIIDLQK